MAKYSYELKKEIAIAYLSGEGGYGILAKKFNIPQECIIRRWINSHKTFGNEGIMRLENEVKTRE